IRDEVFSEVMLPDGFANVGAPRLRIFVIGESIGVVKFTGATSCDVWVMKEYCVKESWTKLYTIDLLGWIKKAVGFSKSGEALLAFRPLGLSYHKIELVYVYNYIESLLLLKRSAETESMEMSLIAHV
ncbi:hypothetical protein MIMGU_mgv11b017855mg, partial [Erythranthe guttata]